MIADSNPTNTKLQITSIKTWLVGSLILLVIAALLLVTYIKSQWVDQDHHNRFIYELTRLESSTSELNEKLLKTNFRFFSHFDFLEDELISLIKDSHQFAEKFEESWSKPFGLAWQEYEEKLHARRDQIEDFKSHYAVLKNSLNYLPTTINEAIDHFQQDTKKLEHIKGVEEISKYRINTMTNA
jgi:hypothetical protein